MLIKDEVNAKEIVWGKLRGDGLKVELDTTMTPKIKEETKTRELIRKIQNERRKLGFGLKEKAKIYSDWLPKSKLLLGQLKKITLAKELKKGNFKVEKAS